MTGFNSKRNARAQLEQEPDALIIAYQSGYYDGKKAALAGREWVGLTPEETLGFNQHEMTVVKYVNKVLREKNA